MNDELKKLSCLSLRAEIDKTIEEFADHRQGGFTAEEIRGELSALLDEAFRRIHPDCVEIPVTEEKTFEVFTLAQGVWLKLRDCGSMDAALSCARCAKGNVTWISVS